MSYIDAGASSNDDNHRLQSSPLYKKHINTTGEGACAVGEHSDHRDRTDSSAEDSGTEATESDINDESEMSDGVDEAVKKCSDRGYNKATGGSRKIAKVKKPWVRSCTRVYWNDDMVCRSNSYTVLIQIIGVLTLNYRYFHMM